MTVERYLRLIAGTAVLISLALGYWVSPWFFLFTAFVGVNLFQSAFTDTCPVKVVLKKIVTEPAPSCCQELPRTS